MTRSQNDNLDYNQGEIERKWQGKWQDSHLHKVNDDDQRPKWFEMTMWPYTSGDLHIGHWTRAGRNLAFYNRPLKESPQAAIPVYSCS